MNKKLYLVVLFLLMLVGCSKPIDIPYGKYEVSEITDISSLSSMSKDYYDEQLKKQSVIIQEDLFEYNSEVIKNPKYIVTDSSIKIDNTNYMIMVDDNVSIVKLMNSSGDIEYKALLKSKN